MPEIKFCGLMRAVDALEAARLGARYAGVVFAGGPRRVSISQAMEVFLGPEDAVARVGVFGTEPPEAIAAIARAVALDVVQLHGDPDPAAVDALRQLWDGEVWPVLRVSAELPAGAAALFAAGDAVVLDARVDGALGGTGQAFDWESIAAPLERARGAGRLVLAGGLRPETVARGVRLLAPDIVDVSSGVESAPGIKDHARMRAFVTAARGGSPA